MDKRAVRQFRRAKAHLEQVRKIMNQIDWCAANRNNEVLGVFSKVESSALESIQAINGLLDNPYHTGG